MISAILGKSFFLSCYNPLGEMMDMLVLTNSSINFLLYCFMSSQFRTTGKKIIGIKRRRVESTLRGMSARVEVKFLLIDS